MPTLHRSHFAPRYYCSSHSQEHDGQRLGYRLSWGLIVSIHLDRLQCNEMYLCLPLKLAHWRDYKLEESAVLKEEKSSDSWLRMQSQKSTGSFGKCGGRSSEFMLSRSR